MLPIAMGILQAFEQVGFPRFTRIQYIMASFSVRRKFTSVRGVPCLLQYEARKRACSRDLSYPSKMLKEDFPYSSIILDINVDGRNITASLLKFSQWVIGIIPSGGPITRRGFFIIHWMIMSLIWCQNVQRFRKHQTRHWEIAAAGAS